MLINIIKLKNLDNGYIYLNNMLSLEKNKFNSSNAFQEKDNNFTEWIDSREVDKGSYEKIGDNTYRIRSEKQDFDIILKDDNSFEIIIK